MRNHQPGDRRKVVRLDLHPKQPLDFSDLNSTENFIGAIARGNNLLCVFAADVFVFDLAHNLFEDVFDGYQAGDAAVLIDHHRQINVRLLHFFEQLGHRLGFRHKVNRPDEWGDGRIRLAGRQRRQDVAHVNHSFDIVDLIAINRQARMS